MATDNNANNTNNECDEIKENADNTMKSGDCIILMDRSHKFQHITLGSKMCQRINRTSNINLSILLNKKYGSVFELIGNKLTETSANNWKSLNEQTNLDTSHNEIRNNEQIFHQTNNQKLTQEEILKMKSENNNNNKLINKIASSSKTFNLKTEFSKEKYLKSKKKKHSNRLLLALKANSSNICEMYFTRKPDKTMGMRMDTISQILSLANIHYNQYILCVESLTGLLIGSMVERMNGLGKIFSIYCSKNPTVEIANNMFYYNGKDNMFEMVYNVNIGLFNDPLWVNDTDENNNKLKTIIDSNSKLKKYEMSRPNLYNIKEWIKFEKCDSLIICCKYNPFILFKHLYEYLDYGCPFVVWSEYIQPLIQIKEYIEKNKNSIGTVGFKIYENWFREQQILPQRTHPMVNMVHLGGYILTGIKVKPKPSNIENDNHNPPSVKKRKIDVQ